MMTEAMQQAAMAGMGALTLLAAWTSIVVFRRYLDTRFTPALLVALAFFLNFVVFPVAMWSVRTIVDGGGADTTGFAILRAVCINTILGSTLLYGVFTRIVFRSGSTTMTVVLIGVGAVLAVAQHSLLATHPTSVLSFEGPQPTFLVTMACELFIFAWLTYESFTMWSNYRREQTDTPRDPLVIDRFRLWGVAGAGYCVALLANFSFAPGIPDMEQPLFTTLKGIGLLPFIVGTYLSWAPPRWYVRRIAPDRD